MADNPERPHRRDMGGWLRRHWRSLLGIAFVIGMAATLARFAIDPGGAQSTTGSPAIQSFASSNANKQLINRAVPLIEDLARDPSKLPDRPGPEVRVMAISGTLADRPGVFGMFDLATPSVFSAGRGSLRFDRALAARRTTQPEYWAFVFANDPDDSVYWIPVSDPRRVRVEGEGIVTLADAPLALRLPLIDSQTIHDVALFSSDPNDALTGPVLSFRLDPTRVSGP